MYIILIITHHRMIGFIRNKHVLTINFDLVYYRPTSLDASFLGHALFALHALPVSSFLCDP